MERWLPHLSASYLEPHFVSDVLCCFLLLRQRGGKEEVGVGSTTSAHKRSPLNVTASLPVGCPNRLDGSLPFSLPTLFLDEPAAHVLNTSIYSPRYHVFSVVKG